MFFMKSGELFNWENIIGGYTTKYFLILANHENCMTLMGLLPCSSCKDTPTFIPTHYSITIEKNAFCGYHLLDDVALCQCEYNVVDCPCGCKGPCTCKDDCSVTSFQDTFSQHFSIPPGNNELVLWQSNMAENQSGVMRLHVEEQTPGPVKIILQQINGNQIILLQTDDIHLDQCEKVIIKTNGKMKVVGTFQIDMKSKLNI